MTLSSFILISWLSLFSTNAPYAANGKASYYSDRMQGQRTASGERYDKDKLTAAHATLPFNTWVRVTNSNNGLSVVVRINDRMARSKHRIIDLSRKAAADIDIIRSGYGSVQLKEVENKEAEQQEAPVAVSEAQL